MGRPGPKGSLTDEQVKEIRELDAAGETVTAIAAAYGCNSGTVSQIVRGLVYKHAPGPIRGMKGSKGNKIMSTATRQPIVTRKPESKLGQQLMARMEAMEEENRRLRRQLELMSRGIKPLSDVDRAAYVVAVKAFESEWALITGPRNACFLEHGYVNEDGIPLLTVDGEPYLTIAQRGGE